MLETTALPALTRSECLPGELLRRLERHANAARGAYAPATERAIKSDTAIFAAWCAEYGHISLPTSPESLVAFVDAQAKEKAPATVRRYISSIGHLHKAAGLDNPAAAPEVRLAVRRMNRSKGTRQNQKHPLNRVLVDKLLDAAPDSLLGLRDRALLSVAYDSLCRRSELVSLDVSDLGPIADDGSATVLIRRSKTDQEGQGATVWLGPDTIEHVKVWLAAAGIAEGSLFRSVRKGGRIGGPLRGEDVPRIYKRLAAAANLPKELVVQISGHSTRIGTCQDMAAAGIELAAILQSGRWKTPAMAARYTENLVARRGGAAKLAAIQNRV